MPWPSVWPLRLSKNGDAVTILAEPTFYFSCIQIANVGKGGSPILIFFPRKIRAMVSARAIKHSLTHEHVLSAISTITKDDYIEICALWLVEGCVIVAIFTPRGVITGLFQSLKSLHEAKSKVWETPSTMRGIINFKNLTNDTIKKNCSSLVCDRWILEVATGWIADLRKPVLKVTRSVSTFFRYRTNDTLKGGCVSKCSKNVKGVLKQVLNWFKPCRANFVYSCCYRPFSLV